MSRNSRRRAHDARMQKRAELLEKRFSIDTNPDPEKIKKRAKKMRDHLKICSCPICCNPRRKKSRSHEKEDIHERRINLHHLE